MRTFTVQLKTNKALEILYSLEEVDLIKILDELKPSSKTLQKLSKIKPKRKSKKESFFDVAGIWKDKEITIEEIRSKAWPKQK
jgi:hypothetical protein